MPSYGVGFNHLGQFTTYPQVFSRVNADDLDMRNQGPTGVLALLATGAGFFEPKKATALPLATPPNRFLSAGDLLVTAEYGVRRFPELDRGPATIYVVPVNPSTKSTKTESSSTPTALFTVTSRGWGLKFNEITTKMETGKFTVALPTVSGTITEVYPFSTVAALVADINARSGLVTATFTAEGTPANHAAAAMTGATEPAAVTQDWTDALQALNGIRVNVVHVASSSSTVWALLSDYVIQRRARGIIGSAVKDWNGTVARGTAMGTLKTEAAGLNARRMMHVGIGADGLAGYLTAARHAALAATLEPSVPMTQRYLDFKSLEARLDIHTEVGAVDGLLINGVAPPVEDPAAPGTFIVSRGLSTFIGNSNLYDREHSVLAAVDAVQTTLEDRMRQFLGREGTAGALQRALSLMDQTLNEMTKPTSAIRINGYDRASLRAEFTSDTVMRLFGNITPIPPINFIDINLRLERTELAIDFDVPLA